MWDTNIGERVLEGKERSVYLELCKLTVAGLQINMGGVDSYYLPETGNHIFDKALDWQKILLLAEVVPALLNPDIKAPGLHNLMEATAYFPIAVLRSEIDDELYDGNSYYWRELLWPIFEDCRATWDDGEDEDEDDAPEPHQHSDDSDLFEHIVQHLEDRIFTDRDWTMAATVQSICDEINPNWEITTTAQSVKSGIDPTIAYYIGYRHNYFAKTKLPIATADNLAAAIEYFYNLE